MLELIVHGFRLSLNDRPTPAVTLTPVAPAAGLRPFTAGALMSAAAAWHRITLPGVG